jgi:hypothetical protein
MNCNRCFHGIFIYYPQILLQRTLRFPVIVALYFTPVSCQFKCFHFKLER